MKALTLLCALNLALWRPLPSGEAMLEPAGGAVTPTSHALVARGLVAGNTWGVVSTTSVHLNGTAWGNLLSYSDGPAGANLGTPYFFLSNLDATLQDLAADNRCSLTISQLGMAKGCARDPEDPTCPKLTLSGTMHKVPVDSLERARNALFSRHPEMARWPTTHHFEFHFLAIESIFLLDHYGGAVPITVDEYYEADPAVLISGA
eukprot:jgi/Tetstr1/424355/TSEL_014917.t1